MTPQDAPPPLYHACVADSLHSVLTCVLLRLHGTELTRQMLEPSTMSKVCALDAPSSPANPWVIRTPRDFLEADLRDLTCTLSPYLAAPPCTVVTMPLEALRTDTWPSFLSKPQENLTYTFQRAWDACGKRYNLLETTEEGLPVLLGLVRLYGGTLTVKGGEATRDLSSLWHVKAKSQTFARALMCMKTRDKKGEEGFYRMQNTLGALPFLNSVVSEKLWQQCQHALVLSEKCAPSPSSRKRVIP